MDLNHVTVPCTDLGASVAFYRKLGLRQIVSNPPTYARFECPDGGSTFSLLLVSGPPATAHVIFYFEVPDVDRRVEELESEGLSFELPPTDQPWLWREAHLHDPAGNTVCIYHAGEYRLHPPWRLEE